MVGAGAYLWSRPIRPSLKVIQARMFAQFGVIVGVCAAAAVSLLSADGARPRQPVVSALHIREFSSAPATEAPLPALAAPAVAAVTAAPDAPARS
jgi:hypothetical protein